MTQFSTELKPCLLTYDPSTPSTPHPQILASFTNGSLKQLPNLSTRKSPSKEINKRIEHAIQVRSSERMRKEHITPVTLVFKDTHIEDQVRGGEGGGRGAHASLGFRLLNWPSSKQHDEDCVACCVMCCSFP